MFLQPIFDVLPKNILEYIKAIPSDTLLALEEIRIRQNRPLEIVTSKGFFFITKDKKLTTNFKDSFLPTKDDCLCFLNLITKHSIYAMEEELRHGFVTIKGGHRIGLAGKVLFHEGKVSHLREVTGFNIRIAKQLKDLAKPLLPFVFKNKILQNTLLISPPKCGKTTFLRDLARLISNGTKLSPSLKVSIVDERSEIAACVCGVPTHDVGLRTDVLDSCPKASGMLMLLRSMSPQVIVVDEIGSKEDSLAIFEVINAGVNVFATCHGFSLEEVMLRPTLVDLLTKRCFKRLIVLSDREGPGTVEAIYDEYFKNIFLKEVLSNRCLK